MEAQKKLRVPYAKAVYGEEEIRAVNEVLRSNNTGMGRFTREFEKNVSALFGKKHGVMTNSGSSANLLAVETLNLPEKSEVITPVLTYSTTLAPIVQKNLTPVFVDVDEGRYTANIDQIEQSINKRTRAMIIPSLFGNIPDFKRIWKIAQENDLYVVEDSVHTIGAKIGGQPTGKYSHISTTSFYGSHIITAGGGGGMVCMNDDDWQTRARSLSSCGKASASNESEDVNARYTGKVDGVPYDSKFMFGEIGYNFMPLEIGAAFGVEQLKRLPAFSKIRRKNFDTLMKYFGDHEDKFVLPVVDRDVDTNILAFPLTIRKGAKFTRFDLVKHLENDNIQTRPMFTGNILKQKGFQKISYKSYVGDFPTADNITKFSFLIGCHQGLEDEHMEHMTESFDNFLNNRR